MNLAPFFALQFFDDDGQPLAGGLIYTYESGTTTPQTSYTDQAGGTPNTNPIVLDAAGRCSMWLNAALEYTIVVKTSAGVTVSTYDNIVGVADGNGVVTSVNAMTGDVVLTADDVTYTTGTSTAWFSGADVGAALDTVINRIESIESSGGITAATVSIADSGGYYTGANVEAALQEIGADLTTLSGTTGLPSQTGNSGKFLTTNGTTASWGTVSLAAFTASINSGDLNAGTVAAGQVTYGSRTVTVTGGTSPYQYHWIGNTTSGISAPFSATTSFSGSGNGATVTIYVTCFVTDATGRVTSDQITVTADHMASA